MTQSERPERKGRPQQRIELGSLETYHYIPREDVKASLIEFGLGESRQMVHAVYVSEDGKSAVGLLAFDEVMCKGHLIGNPIFQGVLGAEAMAQTWIVWKRHLGEMTNEQTAKLAGLDKFRFRHSLYPGAVVNFAITQTDGPDKVYGQMLLGRQVLTEGGLEAAIISKEEAIEDAKKRKNVQSISNPLFPFKE